MLGLSEGIQIMRQLLLLGCDWPLWVTLCFVGARASWSLIKLYLTWDFKQSSCTYICRKAFSFGLVSESCLKEYSSLSCRSCAVPCFSPSLQRFVKNLKPGRRALIIWITQSHKLNSFPFSWSLMAMQMMPSPV